MTFPVPPLSGAGGAFALKIVTPGVSRHKLRVHIPHFATSPESTSVVGSTLTDWAYSGTMPGTALSGASFEPTVGQTILNLMTVVKALYGGATDISVAGLWREVVTSAPGYISTQLQQVFPWPNVGPVSGTIGSGGDTLATDLARYLTSYYDGRTAGNSADTANPNSGRRFQLRLNAIVGRIPLVILPVSPSAGGYNVAGEDQHAADQALVGYLSQSTAVNSHTSVIVGHDGTVPAANFQLRVNLTKKAWKFVIENS